MDIETVLQELIDTIRVEIGKTEKELCAMQGALLTLKRQEQMILAKKKSLEIQQPIKKKK